MTFKKAMFVRSAILAAVITAGSAHHCAFAESTNPPPQTAPDDGGGGVPDGAGNGGSGDGGNEAGKAKSSPSCLQGYNPAPAWFPAGPPVNEIVIPMTPGMSVHLVRYDSDGHYQTTFMTNDADDSLVSGTLETWTHYPDPNIPKADMSYVCTN